jgi:hypothetical protein
MMSFVLPASDIATKKTVAGSEALKELHLLKIDAA